MRLVSAALLVMLWSTPCEAQWSQIRRFFSPVPHTPKIDSLIAARNLEEIRTGVSAAAITALTSQISRLLDETDKQDYWAWRPVVALPAFKIVESLRDNAVVDMQVLTSVGGGISHQKLSWDADAGEDGKWKSAFSWSPFTLLVSGNIAGEDSQLDASPAMTVGWLDNVLMVGVGYDLGEVNGRNRGFLLVSAGINFNN